MHHNPDDFSKAGVAKMAWSKPVLSSTKLTDREVREALKSRGSFLSLGMQLRGEGRIYS